MHDQSGFEEHDAGHHQHAETAFQFCYQRREVLVAA